MDNHIVYSHNIEGLFYIGQTYGSNEIEWNRRFQNGNGYKSNKRMYEAIKRVGWKNVVTEILFDNLSHEEANRIEVLMIGLFDTTNPSIGYNKSRGGSGNNQGKNCHSKDYRKEEREEYHKMRRKQDPTTFNNYNYKYRSKDPEKWKKYRHDYYLKKKQLAMQAQGEM